MDHQTNIVEAFVLNSVMEFIHAVDQALYGFAQTSSSHIDIPKNDKLNEQFQKWNVDYSI